MDEADRTQLYNMAWKHWGADTQIDVLIEEMAELTQALLKARRNGVTYSHSVFEELADVLICLEQIETRMKDINMTNEPGTMWEQVVRIKNNKLTRLRLILTDSIQKNAELVSRV